MTSIISLLIVITLAIVTARVASTALTLTGVSEELASFQARSALTGVGFTTDEAESITGHPVRRRIVSTLMLLGSAGVITAIASLILSFVDVQDGNAWLRLAVLAIGLIVLWVLAQSDWLERRMNHLIERALDRWTDLRVRDYANMLHLTGDYKVGELQVGADDWLADRPLADLNLEREGVNVLGITRNNGEYVGAPSGETCIEPGDRVLLYGHTEVLDELDERKKGADGEAEHHRSRQRADRRRQSEKAARSSNRSTPSQSATGPAH